MDIEEIIEEVVSNKMAYLMKSAKLLDKDELDSVIRTKLMDYFGDYKAFEEVDRKSIIMECFTDILCLVAAKELGDE